MPRLWPKSSNEREVSALVRLYRYAVRSGILSAHAHSKGPFLSHQKEYTFRAIHKLKSFYSCVINMFFHDNNL